MVDPQDPLSFWTFQEFVSDRDKWGTQISQIQIPEQAETQDMPETGGLPLVRSALLPAAVLLLGSGVLMFVVLRLRR